MFFPSIKIRKHWFPIPRFPAKIISVFALLFFQCMSIDPKLQQKQKEQINALLELRKQNSKKFQDWAENWESTNHVCYFRGITCKEGLVTEIHINEADLEIVPDQTLRFFPEVKELTFFHNQLKSLDLADLKNVELINISQNKIESLKGLALPKLKILDLTQNLLESIDISDLKVLERLYADKNRLTEIIGINSSHMITINVEENKLTSLDFHKSPQVQFLHANNNALQTLEGLEQLKEPSIIDISNNPDLVVEIPSSWCQKLRSKVNSSFLKFDRISLSADQTKASLQCTGKGATGP